VATRVVGDVGGGGAIGGDLHGEQRGVMRPAIGAHSSADGDSSRRGDGGLWTDTAGTLTEEAAHGCYVSPAGRRKER
jgi:hypothetical protein